MKMAKSFKKILYVSVVGLYFSGVAYFIFDRFVRTQDEFNSHSSWQAPLLHLHGILGLFFIFLFGHIYARHILPGLRQKKQKVSGFFLLGIVVILCLSVPGLYYLVDEGQKNGVAWVHTYLGLVAIGPALFHSFRKKFKLKK